MASSGSSSSSSGTVNPLTSVLSHSISIKLDDTNFLSWKQQIEGVVRSHKLQSFIVNPVIPDQFLSDEDRTNGNVNPEYSTWEQQDSALFTWILSSLSDSLLPTVVNCAHSYQIWNEINDLHFSQTHARSTQLRSELKTIVKGSLTTSEYLRKIKSIVNTLISIGDPVSYRDHLDLIFDGLPEEFSPLMALVFNRGIPCSINEVESMIVSHEARLERIKKKQSGESLISVNVAQVSAGTPVTVDTVAPASVMIAQGASAPSGSHVLSSDSMQSYSQQSFNPNQGNTYGRGFHGQYSSTDQYSGQDDRSGGRPGRGRGRGRSNVQCQICHKHGHDASICYHRNSNSDVNSPGYSPLGSMQNLAQQLASMGMGGFASGYPSFPRAPAPSWFAQPFIPGPQLTSPQYGPVQQFGYGQQHGVFGGYGGSPSSQSPGVLSAQPHGSQYALGSGTQPWATPKPLAYHNPQSRPPQSYLTGPVGSSDSGSLLGPAPNQQPQGFLSSSVSQAGSSGWFPDSGATHHITNDSTLFSDHTSVASSDHVLMGNGQGVSIKSVGVAHLSSPTQPHTTLTLNNLLLVPSITKNLVSVRNLLKIIQYSLSFTPHSAL